VTYRQAAAEVRANYKDIGTAGPEAWDEFRESLGRLLALFEAEDPVPVSRKTLERWRESTDDATWGSAIHGDATMDPEVNRGLCNARDEMAALLNKETSK
jgi:hypothetical protein